MSFTPCSDIGFEPNCIMSYHVCSVSHVAMRQGCIFFKRTCCPAASRAAFKWWNCIIWGPAYCVFVSMETCIVAVGTDRSAKPTDVLFVANLIRPLLVCVEVRWISQMLPVYFSRWIHTFQWSYYIKAELTFWIGFIIWRQLSFCSFRECSVIFSSLLFVNVIVA